MRDMHNAWGGRWILAGVIGAVLGALAEALIARLAGRAVLTDGMMWGAVLAILLVSLPNFVQMGHLVTKSERTAVNLLVGILLFVVISLVIMTVFFGILLVLSRLLS